MHNNSFKCPINFLDKILVWLTNYLLLSIQEAHLPFPFIRVPKVFQHLTRKRVLTMEWIIGESPTDLLSVSTGNSIDHGSRYTERQQFDAKRRLLDLVCNKDLHTYPLYLALTLSLAPKSQGETCMPTSLVKHHTRRKCRAKKGFTSLTKKMISPYIE